MKRTIACSIVAVSALCSAPALACSICRCGDPTFNALGKEDIAQSGLWVAVDWDRVEKSQGTADERDLTETEEGERVHASGLADPEIYGQMRLWSSGFEGDVGIRTSSLRGARRQNILGRERCVAGRRPPGRARPGRHRIHRLVRRPFRLLPGRSPVRDLRIPSVPAHRSQRLRLPLRVDRSSTPRRGFSSPPARAG